MAQTPAASARDDHAWEKEYAPRITRGRLMLVAAIYGVWLLFLAGLAVERWFFSLQ